MSTTSVRFSATASDAPKLIAVVVLPTPPFWFAMAMTWDMNVEKGLSDDDAAKVGEQYTDEASPQESDAP